MKEKKFKILQKVQGMESNIKISVIIPIYNMDNWIGKCLDNVLSQTLKEIEVICVDDGSTDKTTEILDEYSMKYESVKVIRQKREGSGPARNAGIRMAQGDFVAFMDSDDYYPEDDVLETLYEMAGKHGVYAAGGSMLEEMEGWMRNYGEKNNSFFEEDTIISFSDYQYCYGYTRFIFKRSMLLENDIFFPAYVRYQDPPFLMKALMAADHFLCLSKPSYVYRKFDKKIEFTSKEVINDVGRGVYDIIHTACEMQYDALLEQMLRTLDSFKIWFFLHITRGNHDLYCLMKKMNEEMYEKCHNNALYYLNMTLEEIRMAISRYENKVNGILNRMLQKKVVIYGAGILGKMVYDTVSDRKDMEFAGFAISEKNPSGTARGQEIRCIDDYIGQGNDLVLVVAAQEPLNSEMVQTAVQKGFKYIIPVAFRMVDVSGFEITDHKFAV